MFKELLLTKLLLLTAFVNFAQQASPPQLSSVMSREAYSVLQRHIEKHRLYPEDARKNFIQGVVYLQLQTDESGKIIPASVQPYRKLFPSCDEEAARVLKLFTEKLDVGTTGNLAGNFIVPIRFTRSAIGAAFPSHSLPNPVQTVVVPKPKIVNDPDWAVYGERGLEGKIGSVSPGDSVQVKGWAAWSYYIESQHTKGYVSYRALLVNPAMDSISKVLNQLSHEEEEVERNLNNLVPDSIVVAEPRAHLSLNTNKKSVFIGECATITLAFNVSEQNQARLQFYDLETQVLTIGASLAAQNCYIVSSRIEEVTGQEISIEKENYTSYKIYQGSYCPTTSTLLEFDSISLKMAILPAGKIVPARFIDFRARPVSIRVKPLPKDPEVYSVDNYKMVGRFFMKEELREKEIAAGKIFHYVLTVHGAGLTFPLQPPRISTPGFRTQLVDVMHSDTIIRQEIKSEKTFVYAMMADKEGIYSFRDKYDFKFFNPATGKTEILSPKMNIVVGPAKANEKSDLNSLFNQRDAFIAMDFSRSMEIADYHPNRLEVVKNAVKDFYRQGVCDVGLVIFGANVRHYPSAKNTACYSSSSLDSISTRMVKNGTAIGDAIWWANISKKDAVAAKLVIIGDGDNTAGFYTPESAAQLALKNNLKVYAIGIGHTGLVPYGKDEHGKPYMIDNTFSDMDFKKVASITGGKYYWAKDAAEITRILSEIFAGNGQE